MKGNIDVVDLKTIGDAGHRVSEETIDIYYSSDNMSYTKLNRDSWKYERNYKGNVTLIITEPVSAQYIKVHSKFDDRNADFEIIDNSEFTNLLKNMITVYRREERATINYGYDSVGNRIYKRLTATTVKEEASIMMVQIDLRVTVNMLMSMMKQET